MLALSAFVAASGILWFSGLSFDFCGCHVLWQHGLVFEVPPLIADCDGGWCVSCRNVAVEGDDVTTKRGPVGIGEREFLYSPNYSDVASWLFDNDEEIWPLLLRQRCECAHNFCTW